MSDPNHESSQERERDELELEREPVRDLDVDDDQSGFIRGGCSFTTATHVLQR